MLIGLDFSSARFKFWYTSNLWVCSHHHIDNRRRVFDSMFSTSHSQLEWKSSCIQRHSSLQSTYMCMRVPQLCSVEPRFQQQQMSWLDKDHFILSYQSSCQQGRLVRGKWGGVLPLITCIDQQLEIDCLQPWYNLSFQLQQPVELSHGTSVPPLGLKFGTRGTCAVMQMSGEEKASRRTTGC